MSAFVRSPANCAGKTSHGKAAAVFQFGYASRRKASVTMPAPLSPSWISRVPRGTYHGAMRAAHSSEAYAPAEQPVTTTTDGLGRLASIQSTAACALTAPRCAMVALAYSTVAFPQCKSPVQYGT